MPFIPCRILPGAFADDITASFSDCFGKLHKVLTERAALYRGAEYPETIEGLTGFIPVQDCLRQGDVVEVALIREGLTSRVLVSSGCVMEEEALKKCRTLSDLQTLAGRVMEKLSSSEDRDFWNSISDQLK
jgi:hypothetical protein